MTATFNPQAAADQARNAYRDVTAQLGLLALDTAIPEAVRALDDKTVSHLARNNQRSALAARLLKAEGPKQCRDSTTARRRSCFL